MVEVAETTLLSGFVHSAVIVVVPVFTPVASPEALTVAIVGMLELHLSCAELVTSSIRPELPVVPSAINWPVWPVADNDCEFGLMESAVIGSVVPPITVKVAVPVTTVLLEFVAMAVMVVEPWPRPVASPPRLIVATCALLERQVTMPVRSCVSPDAVVPIAINWLV